MTHAPDTVRSPLSIWLVAGEESGDQLGAKLMQSLQAHYGMNVVFGGVGGSAMERSGFKSLFPIKDIAVMGLSAVIKRLPTILKSISQTAQAVVAANPDILIIIDSPDFTHRVAKSVRKSAPHIPIVDYVSPSVWAWRPGRAKRMRSYIDHVLAILPFEPGVHEKLGGPPCTYVGHPLIERIHDFRPSEDERTDYRKDPFKLLVLPGSRTSEINHLMGPFGEAVQRFISLLKEKGHHHPVEVVLPAVPHLAERITRETSLWPIQPRIVIGEDEKLMVFRSAHLALAASGTVTLELALSQIPMVVAYKVSKLEEQLRFLVKANSIVLANLILEENIIPEYIQDDCNPEILASALFHLSQEGTERNKQMDAFQTLDHLMSVAPDTPSIRAVRVIDNVIQSRQ